MGTVTLISGSVVGVGSQRRHIDVHGRRQIRLVPHRQPFLKLRRLRVEPPDTKCGSTPDRSASTKDCGTTCAGANERSRQNGAMLEGPV